MNKLSNLRTWLPVVTGMACLGLGAGLISIFGFFVQPLSTEFGVGAATINAGPIALLLVPAIVAPLVGKFVDEQPIRRILLIGSTLAMVSLFAASQAPSLWLAGTAFMFFALGLALYGPVVVNGMLVKTFPGREARAAALAAMGISLASIALPPLVGLLMENFQWRWALASLAVGALVVLWVAILVGTPAAIIPRTVTAVHVPDNKSFYRAPAFWLIGLCVALALVSTVVLVVCYPLHFLSRGFDLTEAAGFVSLSGVVGLVGKSLVALTGDMVRRHAKWMAASIALIQTSGMLVLLGADTTAEVIPAICLLGFSSGAFLPMQPYLNSQYFDVRIIGQVNGAQMPLLLPFALVGLPLSGYVYDQTGSYAWVITGLALALGLSALSALLLPSTTITAAD
jgi:predicted MFS family arabinose efflux permease